MPIENNPERIAILSANLKKLIANKSINNIRVDVKITDNLETIPWWNIVARIWNKSHLNSRDVAKTLLKAVQNPTILHELDKTQLDNLHKKLLGIITKFTHIIEKNRRNDSIQPLMDAQAIVLEEFQSRRTKS